MFKLSFRAAVTFSLILVSHSAFAGLNLQQVEGCIANEMDLVRVVEPLKAQFIQIERQGSVTEIINMLKANSESLATLSSKELNSFQGRALQKEMNELNAVFEKSNSCQDARNAMLSFATINDKRPLLSLSVFFEKNERLESELSEWNQEAREALEMAGYTKALSSFDASHQPALSLLLVSGETTSVLDEQFVLGRDSTMKSALMAIVGEDAPAQVLEQRLAEKMRKESLQKMENTLRFAREFIRR